MVPSAGSVTVLAKIGRAGGGRSGQARGEADSGGWLGVAPMRKGSPKADPMQVST